MLKNDSLDELYSKFTEIEGHEKYGVNAYGDVMNLKTLRLMTPEIVRGGYKRVALDGKHYYIHKIVASTFVPNPNGKRYILHINHDKGDNFYKNLIWSNHYIYDR